MEGIGWVTGICFLWQHRFVYLNYDVDGTCLLGMAIGCFY
jgi:hypothetical protein